MEESRAAIGALVGRLTWARGHCGHTAEGSYPLFSGFLSFLHLFMLRGVLFCFVFETSYLKSKNKFFELSQKN